MSEADRVAFGVLGGLYGSLGVVQAAQNAFNKVWAVPRNNRPNPIMARVISLLPARWPRRSSG